MSKMTNLELLDTVALLGNGKWPNARRRAYEELVRRLKKHAKLGGPK